MAPVDPGEVAAVERISVSELADPAARLWLYGKRETAPGRKMGHVNRLRPLLGPLD